VVWRWRRQAAGALATAYVIREVLRSDMPIEVFYSGPEEAFSGRIKEALEALPGVRLRDLTAAMAEQRAAWAAFPAQPPLRVLRGYAAKVFAVLASPFREAVLLDAGAVLFVDPHTLLGLPSYRQHGLAIFNDYVPLARWRWKPVLREVCVDYGRLAAAFGGMELDSSCVVVDKEANFDALAVAAALNSELQEQTYCLLVGDKDTWGLAMLHVGKGLSTEGLEPGYLLVDRHAKVGGWLGGCWTPTWPERGCLPSCSCRPARACVYPSHQSSPLCTTQGKARKVAGHLQFLRDPASGLVPIHHNNQMLDFREFPSIRNRTFVETYARLGDVLMHNRRRDCRAFPAADLSPLPQHVAECFSAVARALRAVGIDHCLCRDDWITCEQDIVRLRKRYFLTRLIDWIIPPNRDEM
jgi:hypothetical protein